jgi:hypothetical protein
VKELKGSEAIKAIEGFGVIKGFGGLYFRLFQPP